MEYRQGSRGRVSKWSRTITGVCTLRRIDMSKPKRFPAVCLLLAAAFVMMVCISPAMGADAEEEKAKAEVKMKVKLEKKAQEAERLKERKEEAERIKRQKAEMARAKADARAAAKAESKRLAQVDAETQAVADAEILAAKQELNSQMVDLQAKADHQAAQIKARLEELKSDYEGNKAALAQEYKDKIAQAEDKASVENEYKAKKLNLSEKYKSDVASVKQLRAEHKAEISQSKTVIENEYDSKVATANAKARRTSSLAKVMNIELPEDNTPTMTVSSVEFSGNILITTAQIIDGLPIIWSASGEPLSSTPAEDLYDFRVLSEVLLEPGAPRQVSARTIRGFTSYVLSLYRENDYAGIYVYVPKSAMVGTNQLKNDVLLIEVLEAPVTTVTVRSYDADQNLKEKGYLRQDAIQEWSPVKAGGVANEKELNDFVNLLNQNPDRYVSATVTKGAQPNTLAVEYDVYEVNPWHWFIQIDNAGTQDRRWTPRIGVINTNLLGIDDTFMAIYQAPWDSDIDENYSLYGSYDFPIMGPKLRLNIYAGYSQFDVNPDSGPFNFLGNGSFFGSVLRYNVLQTESDMPLLGRGWFFDIKGMTEYTRSKITPRFGGLPFSTSSVRFWMWGWGLELHKKDDMSTSSVSFDRWESMKGQSGGLAFAGSRAGAVSDFSIYDFRARHSRFLNTDKIHRLSGSFRWIQANERLVSAKMTSFGGMYTIRGYDESEIVADGGILASFQYEYDLIAVEDAGMTAEEKERMKDKEKDPYEIKRVAPLAFVDYGRTNIRRAGTIVGEAKHEELMSLGVGALLDVGDNFSGAVYYGYPLIPTPDTRSGKGRVNASFMLKW